MFGLFGKNLFESIFWKIQWINYHFLFWNLKALSLSVSTHHEPYSYHIYNRVDLLWNMWNTSFCGISQSFDFFTIIQKSKSYFDSDIFWRDSMRTHARECSVLFDSNECVDDLAHVAYVIIHMICYKYCGAVCSFNLGTHATFAVLQKKNGHHSKFLFFPRNGGASAPRLRGPLGPPPISCKKTFLEIW